MGLRWGSSASGSQMDSSHSNDKTGSFSGDEEMNRILLKLAIEYSSEENFLFPVNTTPVNSPPIHYFDFLRCKEESEKTIMQPKESVTKKSRGLAQPIKSEKTSSQGQCDSEDEVTSKVCNKNNELVNPSQSIKPVRPIGTGIKIEMDMENPSAENPN